MALWWQALWIHRPENMLRIPISDSQFVFNIFIVSQSENDTYFLNNWRKKIHVLNNNSYTWFFYSCSTLLDPSAWAAMLPHAIDISTFQPQEQTTYLTGTRILISPSFPQEKTWKNHHSPCFLRCPPHLGSQSPIRTPGTPGCPPRNLAPAAAATEVHRLRKGPAVRLERPKAVYQHHVNVYHIIHIYIYNMCWYPN